MQNRSLIKRALICQFVSLFIVSAGVAQESAMVQLGSYQNEVDALSTARKINSQYPRILFFMNANVRKTDLGSKGIWYRLQAGPYAPEEAKLICVEFTKVEVDCLVIKHGNTPSIKKSVIEEALEQTSVASQQSNFDFSILEEDAQLPELKSGAIYDVNEGIIDAAAVDRLKHEAEAKIPEAQFKYGKLWDNGWVVPVDKEKAAYWYYQSASQGYAKAQNNLGALYGNGEGLPRNIELAYYWFYLATKTLYGLDLVKAQRNLSRAANLLDDNKAQILEKMAIDCRTNNYQNCQ